MTNMIHAENFTTLWKQADDARTKDLPASEQKVLQSIIDKATKEKAYGHLLKAELRKARAAAVVSVDSLAPAVARMAAAEEAARKDNPVLSMVYASVLGHLYKENSVLSDDHETLSADYFQRSLSQPLLLAREKATGFVPLVKQGKDSRIFGDDLLSMLAYEAGDMRLLHEHYEQAGNRPATFITALALAKDSLFKSWENDFGKSAYVAALDSLIDRYGDLSECGEAAVERMRMMEQCDVPVEEQINYIDTALRQWGSWPRTAALTNRRLMLTQPLFDARLEDRVQLPGRSCVLFIDMVRNVGEVNLTLTRLKLDATTTLNPNNAAQYEKLKAAAEQVVQSSSRRYYGRADYAVIKDSMTIDPLPVGLYLIEMSTDNKDIKPARALYYVTDLYVLCQELPGSVIRYAVVSGSTGQPVPGASLKLSFSRYGNRNKTVNLTCGANGETTYRYSEDAPSSVLATTNTDPYLPATSLWSHFRFYENDRLSKISSLYTDRSIYRPGQTVHVAMVAFTNKNGLETQATAGQKVTLTMRDANYKEVEQKEVVTDSYGTASADFVLPTGRLNGRFTIQSNYGNGMTHIRVDEYKRPTFQLEFPEVDEHYAHGDTVQLKAHARSYAGVPVQGAHVKYRVTRQEAWWWHYGDSNDDDGLLAEGETTTDADGAFVIPMPMTLPEWALVQKTARFYSITAWAEVTDGAGESHEGEKSLPLGTRTTAFGCDLPQQELRDKLHTITFTLRNAAGTPIDGQVRWQLDGGSWHETPANKATDISSQPLASGRHTVNAICGTDTLEQNVVVFSMDDERPVVETHDWFYQTANEFPRDGQSVALQVGSSDDNTHILYTIIAGDRLLESGTFDVSNQLQTRRFTYREEYGSGLLITYAWVKAGKVYTHTANITRPLPDKRLHLSWTTFRDRLTPGQKEEWTLSVTHPDGKPAQAQLLAAMYDKSLDQILSHHWSFDAHIYQNKPSTEWRYGYFGRILLNSNAPYQALSVSPLTFNRIDPDVLNMDMWMIDYNDAIHVRGTSRMKMASRSSKDMVVLSASMPEPMAAMEEASYEMADMKMSVAGYGGGAADEAQTTNDDSGAGGTGSGAVQLRENLNETAFFYPTLHTDDKGVVTLRFTLPESLTTWRVLTLAHDRNMNYGLLGGEAVARKDVMIQPNMPRFVRLGDKATITARIINSGEMTASGEAQLQLTDPETQQTIATLRQKFSVEAEGSETVTFTIPSFSSLTSSPSSLYICKVMASGKGFSDGEQHYLPVLPDVEMEVNTLPLTLHEAGVKTIDLTALFPSTAQNRKLTVEYTNNPAWMMVQALTSVAETSEKNVVSQATAFYANSLGAYIMRQNPGIKTTIEQWQHEQGSETSLMSNLQKNKELKTLLEDETPWMSEGQHESEQKRQLVSFFDENTMNNRLEQNIKLMNDLQNDDGSWSWWPGMPGSRYMTVYVAQLLTRLNTMIGEQTETRDMLQKAMRWLGRQMVEEVKQMRKIEKESKVSDLRPSETAVDVLYIWSLDGTRLTGSVADARDYLVDHLAKQTRELTIYGKAVSAVILARNNHRQKASEYLESIRQYSVSTPEAGRYFDSPKAYYSWCDYKIPTQVAAIEALQTLEPADRQTVEEMQRWLLHSKRTQSWDTPVNSANAVYVFLNGNSRLLDAQPQATFAIDGHALTMPKATAGMGYVKTAVIADGKKKLTVNKTSTGTSWGALYAQFLQSVTDISQMASGLTVRRDIITPTTVLKPGDKVTVRIIITADRDYDFVQLVDKRAACLEPVGQLSGYHWGYYCSPKDNTTNYYFDRLSKGKHVVETEYYIDRKGTYSTGTCTVQCAYAPEFTARAAAQILVVE